MKYGFTLIETLVVIGILITIAVFSFPALYTSQKDAELNNSAQEISSLLRLAREKTLSSDNLSEWGIYFSTTTSPHQYILFKGNSFAQRDPSFDETKELPQSIEFSSSTLENNEVVFKKITGEVEKPGMITLRIKALPQKEKSIYIAKTGLITAFSPEAGSDEQRLKDSRHVHFLYTRYVSTTQESIILTFEGGVSKEISIQDNLKAGGFSWEGDINVNGEIQHLKIHTHRLNNPDTLFCVHRDRRYNTKAVNIDISGDPNYPTLSPTLIRYTAEGETQKGSSSYVGNPIWQ